MSEKQGLYPEKNGDWVNQDTQELIEWRRDLHRLAELGFKEEKTSNYISAKLKDFGLTGVKQIAKTGLVFDLLPDDAESRKRPFLLLRADMDALPIQEETAVEYASKTPGVMHACGHDTHMAMLLKVIQKISKKRASLPLRFFFQPAEEGLGGAELALKEGLLDENSDLGRSPDYAFGAHIWSELELGRVVCTPGPSMAGAYRFDVKLLGLGSHAATPHFSKDAIVIVSSLITSLQAFVSRMCDPMEPVVLSIGNLQAGSSWNIIAETAEFSGTVRAFSPELFNSIPQLLEDYITNYVSTYGAKAEVSFERIAKPVINSTEASRKVKSAAQNVRGVKVIDETYKTMGAEDFAAIAEKIPSCFFFIGAAKEDVGEILSHHNPRFDIDESALDTGAGLFLSIIEQHLKD